MDAGAYSLAIETSSMQGSITMGRDDDVLDTLKLSQQRRHNIELTPAIDQLFRKHGAAPCELGQVYVSIGPGSFTGLRIAVATAKMLGMTLNAKLVAVPTMDVIVENAVADRGHVAVCLNTRSPQMYCGVYDRQIDGWHNAMGPQMLTPEQLCATAPRPLAIMAEQRPAFDWPADVEVLDPAKCVPRSDIVWRIGCAMAKLGQFTAAADLVPLYARKPYSEK